MPKKKPSKKKPLHDHSLCEKNIEDCEKCQDLVEEVCKEYGIDKHEIDSKVTWSENERLKGLETSEDAALKKYYKRQKRKAEKSAEKQKLSEFEEKLSDLTKYYKPTFKESLEIAKVVQCPFLPKPELRDIEALAENIKKVGLHHPITVRESSTETGFYELIAGARRLAASKKIEKKTIPAYVYSAKLPKSLLFPLSDSENRHRRTRSIVAMAQFFQEWLKTTKVKPKHIAKLMNISTQEVSNYIVLTKLPKEVLSSPAADHLTFNMANILLRKIGKPDKQLEVMKEYEEVVKTNLEVAEKKTAKQFQHILAKEFNRIFVKYADPKPPEDFLDYVVGMLPEMTRKYVTDPAERKILAQRIFRDYVSLGWNEVKVELDEEN